MNKKILSLLFLLVFLCAVAHVSAAEISDDAVASDNSENITLEENADEDMKLNKGTSDPLANGTGDTPTDTSTNTTPTPVVKKSTAVIKVSKAKVAYKKSTKWKIKLVDSKKKPLSKTKILLKIYTGKKSKKVSVWTNAKGIATYNTKSLKAGTHKVVVSLADNTYNFKTVSSSIKVVKQTPLIIFAKKSTMDEGALLSILVLNKKTKKQINGVKLKLLIYTGKKFKTITIKTKKFQKVNGMAGYATNQLSVGTHKVKIMPANIKYSGSKKTSMTIKKSAKKVKKWSLKF